MQEMTDCNCGTCPNFAQKNTEAQAVAAVRAQADKDRAAMQAELQTTKTQLDRCVIMCRGELIVCVCVF